MQEQHKILDAATIETYLTPQFDAVYFPFNGRGLRRELKR